METKFYNSTIKKRIGFDEVIEEIKSYVNEKPADRYQVTVGSDSPGIKNTFFVTAITVLRVWNGGRYFWTKTGRIFCHTLQERIYKEAMLSITLTQELKSRLKETLGEEFFWPVSADGSAPPGGVNNQITVHIDVGQNGPTKDFVEGVIGMVKGHGLEPVIKPFSFCACSVADRHT